MNNYTPKDQHTAFVHSSEDDSNIHAHLPAIFATSTFLFDSAEQGMRRFTGEEPGFIYSRFANPTTQAAEKAIASLETHGLPGEDGNQLEARCLLCASGQGAMSSLFLSILKAGDAILSHETLYGGTYEFIKNVLPDFGIQYFFADLNDAQQVEKLLSANPQIKLIHIESPANPTMLCTDIAGVCEIAKRHDVKVSIDNTVATPYLQQPFRYGVDFIYHSTTKFLNSHGTAIGGAVIGKDLTLMNGPIAKRYKLLGATSNPFDAFLLMNGIKTLGVRMDKHCSNAAAVAAFLAQHPQVDFVNYNGLKDHPSYRIAQKQMRHPGALMSFEIRGGIEAGKQFINHLMMCRKAVSLGTVDTLVSHPASMSHSGMSREDRIASGVTDGLIRMSVGIEGVEDIMDDLDQALIAAT